MTFEVKSGVPIPESGGSQGRKKGRGKWQVLINSMAVGDCVDIPSGSYNPIYVAARRMGIDLTSRDVGAGIVRVWRNN
jgi:hypothetical protein|tara:strand:+ start:1977 stop:2210 length:234 start_codon:yes stop_codon:yes gene_type:complete